MDIFYQVRDNSRMTEPIAAYIYRGSPVPGANSAFQPSLFFATDHPDMKFFGAILLLLAVAYCQGAPDGGRVKRSTIDAGLAALVEQLREIMINGNETLGIPVLEPFQLASQDFDISIDSATLAGTLTDLTANGLTGFTADTLTFSLIGVRFTYCFNWPTITVSSQYSIDGTLIGVMPVYGSGDFDVELTDLNVCGTLGLTSSGGYLVVRTSTVAVTLGDFYAKITGLFNDDDVSALMSAIITDMVPQILVDFETQVNSAVNDIIVSAADEVLGSMTLSELLALIRG